MGTLIGLWVLFIFGPITFVGIVATCSAFSGMTVFGSFAFVGFVFYGIYKFAESRGWTD